MDHNARDAAIDTALSRGHQTAVSVERDGGCGLPTEAGQLQLVPYIVRYRGGRVARRWATFLDGVQVGTGHVRDLHG